MKYFIISAITLLAGLTANAQTVKPEDQKPVAAPSAIVYVNSDSLINNYQYYKVVKTNLQNLSQQAQAEISGKGVAFQKEVAAYQKTASSLNLAQRTATEKRLAKKQQDLQALSQNTGKQLQEEEASQTEKIYDRIASFLKIYAKDKGYKIVLTYSKLNPVMLYGDESLDVTKEVIAGLNDDFKKTGK